MKYWKAGLIFLVAFLIQGSILNMISIGQSTPNVLLCLVVIFSFLYDKEMYGILFGAFFGLLYDVCYNYVYGPTAIAFLLVAVLVMLLRYYANIENTVSMAVVSLISFVTYYVLSWRLMKFTGNPLGLGYVMTKATPVIIMSMIVIIIMYKLMIKDVVKYHKDRYFR